MELKGFQIGAKKLQIGAGISNRCRTDGTRSLPTVSMNNQNWFEICLMVITSIILGNTVTNKI